MGTAMSPLEWENTSQKISMGSAVRELSFTGNNSNLLKLNTKRYGVKNSQYPTSDIRTGKMKKKGMSKAT